MPLDRGEFGERGEDIELHKPAKANTKSKTKAGKVIFDIEKKQTKKQTLKMKQLRLHVNLRRRRNDFVNRGFRISLG